MAGAGGRRADGRERRRSSIFAIFHFRLLSTRGVTLSLGLRVSSVKYLVCRLLSRYRTIVAVGGNRSR